MSSHKHTFSALYWHFGQYGPQDVHVHGCFVDGCDRVLVGRGRSCESGALHKRFTLRDGPTEIDLGPLTRAEALAASLPGWNIRCNRCGAYGARWLPAQRPGWGALALCPGHVSELDNEVARHADALTTLRAVNYEQERV